MENNMITGYSDLVQQIAQLKVARRQQEATLKQDLRALTQSLNPVAIVKKSLFELVNDRELQLNLTKIGLISSADFIIDKILGRNRSVKGFLSSVLVETYTASLISENAADILSGIRKTILLFKK